jgi:hypothetical protein
MAKEAQYDWSESTHTGFEKVDRADLGLPILVLIQDGSAEFKKSHAKHEQKKVEGVQPGDIVHQLTRKIVYRHKGTPLQVIPCSFTRTYELWGLREAGGGFIRNVAPILQDECIRDEKNRDILTLPDGTKAELVSSMVFYCLYQDEAGEWVPGVLKLQSTQLAVGRRWLNQAMGLTIKTPKGLINAPLYSHSWEIGTWVDNRNGNAFYAYSVSNPKLIVSGDLATRVKQVAANVNLSNSRVLEEHSATDQAVC